MEAIDFKESNKNLSRPEGTTEKQCKDLLVFSDGKFCISKWKMSWKERIKCFFQGFVWVSVWSGHTQPPVKISIITPFIKNENYETKCKHKKTYFEDWPDGGAIEVCKKCKWSRYHWEQGESNWVYIEDLEEAKNQLVEAMNTAKKKLNPIVINLEDHHFHKEDCPEEIEKNE